MMGIPRERKKSEFCVKRGSLIVDRLYFNRPKRDVSSHVEAAVEGVPKQEGAQTLAAFGLGDGQPRQKKTRHRVFRKSLDEFRGSKGKLEMTRGQRIVAQDALLSGNNGDIGRAEFAPGILAGVFLYEVVQRGMTAREIGSFVILVQRFDDPVNHGGAAVP